MIGKRRLSSLALALVWTVSCAGTDRPIAPPSPRVIPTTKAPPPPEAKEDPVVLRMLRRASRARHLPSVGPVFSISLSRTALIERVKQHLHAEVPEDEIANEGQVLKLLGFIPEQLDYEATELGLLEAQLAGYYEPADRTMYLVNDLPADEATATLAHELVHALQDQHWDLKERTKFRRGQGDHGFAVSALAEGDATLAMFDVLRVREESAPAPPLPIGAIVAQIRESVDSTGQSGIPHVMRAALAAPYIYGSLFVHTLRMRGGWEAVNGAWERPPSSSEQIIHPEKWEANEAPLVMHVAPPPTLGAGFVSVDDDVYGELSLRLMFDEWLGEDNGAAFSDGWGGDLGVLLKRDDQFAFALHFRHDAAWGVKLPVSKKSAGAVAGTGGLLAALDHALSEKGGLPVFRDQGGYCIERPAMGPLAFAERKGDFAVVAGPAKTGGRAWTSQATCREALAWAHAIVTSD